MPNRLVQIVIGLGLLGLVATGCSSDATNSAPATAPADAPPEVTYEIATRAHVDGPVDYPQSPPVGGNHSPVLQDCGVYTRPILNEHAVHSLEHGAVWIAYRPDLDEATIAKLEAFAAARTHVLVSPYPGLDTAIVLTAWGIQQRLERFDDTVISLFIRNYEQGAQTPEPGAVCSGGTTETA